MKIDASHQMSFTRSSQGHNASGAPASSAQSKGESDLPDISTLEKTEYAGTLTQVGMGKIELPILFVAADGKPMYLPATIDAFVSLDDPTAKGIHMSRLYLELKNNLRLKPLTNLSLKELLFKFLRTHEGLSKNAYVNIKFLLPLERKALVSGEIGFRQYPVEYMAQVYDQKFSVAYSTEILYSSTCPCSAALARQAVKEDFLTKLGHKEQLSQSDVLEWLDQDSGIAATPHAQRSLARIKVRLQEGLSAPTVHEMIDAAEKSLGTPVQSAVKRADEREFARLNAQNLMFCEDAARKLKHLLESDHRITDYHIYVEHQESLHPHNAVSTVVRGNWG